MDDIKSAAEIAMEKIKGLGEATEEERLSWKYVPEGERLAARYLKEEYNLPTELGEYEEKARKHVIDGAGEVLARNIDLPVDDITEKNNRRAMEGLKNIKDDKVSVENVYSNIRRLFKHYAEQGKQQKEQAYQSLKAEFEAKLRQAMQQQMGTTMGANIDVERQPQFQEEWRALQSQLNAQYLKVLEEYKKELLAII